MEDIEARRILSNMKDVIDTSSDRRKPVEIVAFLQEKGLIPLAVQSTVELADGPED